MTASTSNALTNYAVSNSGEVPSLLIERFIGTVHKAYGEGENLLSHFDVQSVVGTNMVSNKYLGGTSVQALVAGQELPATSSTADKNALVVDTVIMARNTVAMLHDVQLDIDGKGHIAMEHARKLKTVEDQMVLQQLISTAMTGGTYDGIDVTGGTRRLPEHGSAVKVAVKDSQLSDPYILAASIDWMIDGLIAQKCPIAGLKIVVPVHIFSTLSDYGIIKADSVSQSVSSSMTSLSGVWKTYGLPVYGSQEFTAMLRPAALNTSTSRHLLSNEQNNYRYDVTATTQTARALVFGRDALLCGRTIGLQGDLFFDKPRKTWFIDTWLSEGAIGDRYDQVGVVYSNGANPTQAQVITKATGKALMQRTALVE